MKWRASERVGSDVLLRAMAISLVVYHHVVSTLYRGYDPLHGLGLKGGMTVLVLLSGYSFARFGLKEGAEGTRKALVATGLRIGIPSYLAIIVFALLAWQFNPFDFLMIGNLVDGYPVIGFFSWYPQALLQLFAILYALFCIPAFSRWFFASPVRGSLALVGAGLLLRLGLRGIMHGTATQWPHMFLWNFPLGWLVLLMPLATTGMVRGKALASLTVVGVSLLGWGALALSGWTLALSGLLLIWAPAVRLPKVITRILLIVSQASLTIFLLHLSLVRMYRDHIAVLPHNTGLVWLIVMAACVAVWIVCAALWRAYHVIGAQQAATGLPDAPSSVARTAQTA